MNYIGGTHIDFIKTKVKQAIKDKYNPADDKSDDTASKGKKKTRTPEEKRAFTTALNKIIDTRISFLVSCCIDKPEFDSQTKHNLKTDASKFDP